MERGTAIPRIYPATDDGTVNGNPVFLTKEELLEKYRDQGVYQFSCQQLMNPTADKAMAFKEEWLSYYDFLKNTAAWNYYLLVDPAGEKKKTSDYTVMVVIACGNDDNYYLIDGLRDRLNLTERTEKLFEFVRKYKPLAVGYEKYGFQADIEHIKYVQELQNYRFKIIALGGQVSKKDRIGGLVPTFQNRKFWLPHELIFVDYEGKARDFVAEFVKDEYLAFPVAVHDDMLDCIARIKDSAMGVRFPEIYNSAFDTMTRESEVEKVETEYDVFG
jgi:phage terminase large subunit-like protein